MGLEAEHPQKLDIVAEKIIELWRKHRDGVSYDEHGDEEPRKGSAILAFCDVGVPAPDKEFGVCNMRADKLVPLGCTVSKPRDQPDRH